jgi:hypothetical protein
MFQVPRDLVQKAFYVWDRDKDSFVDLEGKEDIFFDLEST